MKKRKNTKGLFFKKALVVFNKPLYQIHILEKKDPYYKKLLKQKHPTTLHWQSVYDQHQKSLEGILRTLDLLGVEREVIHRKVLQKIDKVDLVISVGGDGTFLATSHFVKNQLLLGVNAAPSDSTGALCRGRMENFLSILIDLITGDRKPVFLPRLRVKVNNKILSDLALNDVLLAHQSPAGTSRYLIKVGKKQEEQKSSGIWMASGTGSTAAIHSSGMQSVLPTKQCLLYAVREPYLEGKKHKLLRGILNKTQKIEIISKMRQSSIYIDGNHIEVPIQYGEKITVDCLGAPLKAVF